jgi:aryl-alcohol dehydrogenase-like predicted oxidoreductase
MKKRRLGSSDLETAPLIFGGNVLGWTMDEKHSFEVLDTFVAAGLNMIDTADIYARWATGAGGESETVVGNWLRSRKNRQQVIIASKVGMDMGGGNTGLSKKYILKAVEASLKRLQTDHIDLYQSHKDDETVPVEETLDAYQQLIKEGKVRYIGASNFSAERLQQSLDVAKRFHLPQYQTLQPHYNLCERSIFEGPLEKLCVENKLGVIHYFPLASGFLTGKYRSEQDFSKSVRGGSMSKFMNEKSFKILKALDEVAARHKATPASITLAWYMARPSISAPIASATSVGQMRDLVRATELELSQQDIEYIDACSTF